MFTPPFTRWLCLALLLIQSPAMASVEGLMVRQRRIAHFGRETVTMNYHAKLLLGPLGFYATLIWLIIPGIWPVHPAWILLPFAIVMGLTVRLFVSSYKKFL